MVHYYTFLKQNQNLYSPHRISTEILCKPININFEIFKINFDRSAEKLGVAHWPQPVGGGGLKYPRHVSSVSQLLVIKTKTEGC